MKSKLNVMKPKVVASLAFRLVAVSVVFATIMVALSEEARQSLREMLLSNEKEILSAVSADLIGNGDLLRIVKVREKRKIFIEFYELAPRRLIQRLEISDNRDAYINIAGKVTNLAVDDVDGDESQELLIPTFDKNMAAKMIVVKYNAASDQFEPVAIQPSL